MTGIRNDQYLLTLSVDGVHCGVWDKSSGGDADSNEVKYRAGGMAAQKALGGSATTSDITLQRIYDPDRDGNLLPFLISRVGKGRCIVNQHSLDPDGNPKGRPTIWSGILKTTKTPDADSEAATAALWDVVVSADATIGG